LLQAIDAGSLPQQWVDEQHYLQHSSEAVRVLAKRLFVK
jgi:hypothetical protein